MPSRSCRGNETSYVQYTFPVYLVVFEMFKQKGFYAVSYRSSRTVGLI
jgi:hypothetical protein